MNRKAVLLAIVLSLMVMLLATSVVAAGNGRQNGDLPHDGGCASYCARAVIYIEDENGWVPFDYNENGVVETCLREVDSAGVTDPTEDDVMCHKMAGGMCPEVASDSGQPEAFDRCAAPSDNMGFWCRLMHGKDTHTSKMPTGPFPATPGD